MTLYRMITAAGRKVLADPFDAANLTDLLPWASHRIQCLDIQTTAVGNVGGGTDPLMSYQLAADAMDTDGDMALVIAAGGGNGSDDGALTFTFDGNALSAVLSSGAIFPVVSDWWAIIAIVRTGAATQHVFALVFRGALDVVNTPYLLGTVAHNQAIDLEFFGANLTDASNNAVTQRLMATILIKAP
jgi:hypothetical protein